ncbi:hypothetical protein BC830DRAFT_1085237 [Chytriomyces sp. MP71]|nr:hypothetical protein BC830DRAFT_1085237 [Chytriomyces sp. MP71]
MLALANKALQDQVSSEARARSLLERKVTDNKDEIAALKSNVARLQGTTDEMKQTIDALKQRAESLAVDVSSRESQIVRIMDASSKQTSALETKNEWFQRQLDSATNESESLREQVLEMTAKLQNAELLISRVIHIKKALQSGLKDMNLIMTESRAYVTSVLSARTIELVKDGEAQCDLPVKPKNSATQTYAANSIRVQTQTDPNSCNDSSVPISVISGTMGHLVDDLTSEIASHITCLTRQNESLTFRLIAASESSTSLTSASAGTIETLQHTLQSQQASIIDLKSRIAAAAEKERAQSADLSNMRTRLVTSESQRNAQADEIRDCYAVIDYFELAVADADLDLTEQLRVQTTLMQPVEGIVREGKLKETDARVEVLCRQLEEAHRRLLKPMGNDVMHQAIGGFNEIYTDEAKNAVYSMKPMNLEKLVLDFDMAKELSLLGQSIKLAGVQMLLEKRKSLKDQIERLKERAAEFRRNSLGDS